MSWMTTRGVARGLMGSTLLLPGTIPATIVAEEPEKPNFVFILTDDLGWGDLRSYGNRQVRTRQLDRLAQDGARFTQFYVSNPVCSPTRAAFMTGQYPARLGIHAHFGAPERNAARGMPDWLDPEVPTVTQLLQESGYVTGHFGKWHLGSGNRMPSPSAYGINEHRAVNASGPTWDEPDVTFRARSTEAFVDETLRFIEDHRDQPFFVNLWTLVPHATLNPTQEQMRRYAHFDPDGDISHRSARTVWPAPPNLIQAV